MDQEVWKPIAGTEYEASSRGRIRRVTILRPSLSQGGYLRLTVHQSGNRQVRQVHALVAEAFLGKRPEHLFVNHKDGRKLNNRIENLEYVSALENSSHAARMGLYKTGERHPKAKLTDRQARRLRKLWETGKYTSGQLADLFGISRANAHKVAKGKHHVTSRH